MRKLIATPVVAALVALAACSSAPAPAPAPSPTSTAAGNQTGAANPAAAVRAYLLSAQTQDLQAMSGIWGSKDGPARATLPQDELEKRELINIRCLLHDTFDILSDAPTTGGKRAFAVMLRRRDLSRTTNFYAVQGPAGRWYMESFDRDPIQDFCTRR